MWLKIVKPIDSLIDGVSMYRLLLYYLIGLLLAAIGLSAVGDLHYSPVNIAVSAIVMVITCWLVNKVLAYVFEAPVNPESSIITALILALIIPPTFARFGILFMLSASGLAMASKYIVSYRFKHIFNPAAIAVVLTGIGAHQYASWWVGTSVMLPFVIIGGLLVMRKVRREHMVVTFLVVTTLTTLAYTAAASGNLGMALKNEILSSAAFYLGFVMLTEPYTSPPTRSKQLWYAAIVGFLLAPQVHLGHAYTTPEIALVLGNIYAFIVSPKLKLFPELREKRRITPDTVEFVFNPDADITYQPGQYMEWTLPHTHVDSRGSRRYFTLSSSPTERELAIAVKFYDPGSSYKAAMLDIDRNSAIVASQLAGDFTLPKDKDRKLAFIAGGIGITPFRSMVKYMLDTKEHRDAALLYSARTEADFAYRDIFQQAEQKMGLRTSYIVSDRRAQTRQPDTYSGKLNATAIKRLVPDYQERTFYISGTHSMVESMQEALQSLGVPGHHVKVDFFSGYA